MLSIHALLIGIAAWSGTAASSSQVPDSVEVKAVRFVGATGLTASMLRKSMVTEATRCRSPLFVVPCKAGFPSGVKKRFFLTDTAEIARDAERLETLYEVWGYPTARVEHRIVPSGVGIIAEFHIDEGAPLILDSIAVTGLDTITPSVRLAPTLPLRAGAPYALPLLEATETYLKNLLLEHGRPYATIEISGTVSDERRRATIVLDVRPGPRAVFGAVNVQTMGPLEEHVVRKRIAIRAGEPFRLSALEATERDLYALPIVARAVASARPVSGDTVVTVQVLTETRRQRGTDIEGTVSTTDCLEAGAFWRDRYFLGDARMFEIGVSFSNLFAKQAAGSFPCTATGEGEYGEPNYRVQAELMQPSVFGTGMAGMVRLFASRESSPNVFVQRGFGTELAVSRTLATGAGIQLSYAPERNELDAVGLYFCSNYALCTDAEIANVSGMRWLAPAQLLVTWATRGSDRLIPPSSEPGGDWLLDPLPAWRHRLRGAVETAGTSTGSDYSFNRLLLEASTTHTLTPRIELAARTRFGALHGDQILPPQVRMYSGGPQTVRGTEQNLIGPKVIVVAQREVPVACPGACDLGIIDTPSASVRPTGGDAVLEANIESRLWLGSMFQVAAFIDYGRVTSRNNPAPTLDARTESMITPGIGLRVITDLGPIRLDVGYDPSRARRYPVFVESAGNVRFVGTGTLDPFGWDDAGAFRRFTRRLQLHMAIGQAF